MWTKNNRRYLKMSAYAQKRRKVSTSDALLKPFKSPIRRPQVTKSQTCTYAGSSTTTPADSPKKQNVDQHDRIGLQGESPAPVHSSTDRTQAAQIPPLYNNHSHSDDTSALAHKHAALLTHLSSVSADLDKATQALSIESSTLDVELMSLIEIWRAASRQAAEEVYADVRDRVNSIGGLRAWRQWEMDKAAERQASWDDGMRTVYPERNDDNDDTDISQHENRSDAEDTETSSGFKGTDTDAVSC